MGSSIKIILARMMVALVLLVGTHCCASTSSSRPATNSANSASPSHTQVDFYCRKDACPGGVANVGCQCGTGASYGAGCSGKAAQKIALDQRTKDLILREHNLKRNLIACGSIEPFEPAARMAEVTWDAELEHLAWCNVRHCAYGHDHCRSTRAFHFAGQNIAQRTACHAGDGKLLLPPAMKPDETIRKSIGTWFQEHGNATLGMIDRFPANVTGGPIGHFTVMVNEKVRRVGCALIAYHVQRQDLGTSARRPRRMVCLVHYLVCNYSHTNFLQQKTYTKSPEPVQNCSVYSAEYSCLCSSREPLLASGGGTY
ncbi:antigen 5 like allergen Cul n 1-like [Culex pipiens pallens]|uniref:antigen 5 like allergen Cul n 1-like n=1 Tax=Culex pipiens pallens TaxID=42434 RepID=UPI001954A879|nr:antigen 5 like allergen Cul n 1-like [Culex pipiens pallens]